MTETRVAAVATKQIDNDRVIVTEWRFAPGAQTGWHRHEHDYVVCPATNGTLLLETPTGNVEAELKIGQSYFRDEGVEHNVINAGTHELVFIEIELKRGPAE
ncbi:MAG: cupin domain-containing protein [Gammaproteobacteria bacterium]|jgi:quercetin dioxygenase-like cupin family protein